MNRGLDGEAERKAYPLVHTRYEQNDEQEEYQDKTIGKDEQVFLCKRNLLLHLKN